MIRRFACFRLHAATVLTLRQWTDRVRAASRDGFPEKVTAFQESMAAHGREALAYAAWRVEEIDVPVRRPA